MLPVNPQTPALPILTSAAAGTPTFRDPHQSPGGSQLAQSATLGLSELLSSALSFRAFFFSRGKQAKFLSLWDFWSQKKQSQHLPEGSCKGFPRMSCRKNEREEQEEKIELEKEEKSHFQSPAQGNFTRLSLHQSSATSTAQCLAPALQPITSLNGQGKPHRHPGYSAPFPAAFQLKSTLQHYKIPTRVQPSRPVARRSGAARGRQQWQQADKGRA